MGCTASTPARGPPLPGLEPPPADPASTTHRAAAPPAPPRVKLVLLGDSGVGKSCLALRLARGEFDPASAVTVGAAFMSTTVPCGGEGRPVRLDIWDTAGQERYASLAPLYYRGARAAAVVYAVDDAASFARAGHWQPPPQHRPMVVALVGNKADLPEGDRAVSTWEGQAAAAAAGLLFAETSAAEDGGTVEAAFLSIARAVAEADGY